MNNLNNIVYVYCMFNLETRKAYHKMFALIFDTFAQIFRKFINWNYLHHTKYKIRFITLNMCKKQTFNKFSMSWTYNEYYLTSINLKNFLHDLNSIQVWNKHLKHVIVFCQIHVQRAIVKKTIHNVVRYLINQIWNALNKKIVIERMQFVISKKFKFRHLLNDKQNSWILIDLINETSHMKFEYYINARKHDEHTKFSHYQDNNATNRQISLLIAVHKWDNRLTFIECMLNTN